MWEDYAVLSRWSLNLIITCGMEPAYQCRRLRLDSWVRKILWRRESLESSMDRGVWGDGGYISWGHRVRQYWVTNTLLYTLSRWSLNPIVQGRERSDTGEEGELKVEAEIWVVQSQRYAGTHQKLEARNFPLQNLLREYGLYDFCIPVKFINFHSPEQVKNSHQFYGVFYTTTRN